MTTRRRVAAMIRRAGEAWFVKPRVVGGELTKATCLLKSDNRTISNADSVLSLGDLVHPASDPLRLYVVTEKFNLHFHENYSLRKITNYGSLYRFVDSPARDKFGKLLNPEPTLINLAVPLALLPSDKSSDDTSADRVNTKTTYTVITSDFYSVKINDRLEIGDMTLTITEILLSPSGILKFAATA